MGTNLHKKRELVMRNWLTICGRFGVACATIGLLLCVAAAQEASSPLTLRTNDGHVAHIFPTVNLAPALPPDSGPLVYHNGTAPVMQSSVTTYAIYWVPAKLQNGGATSIPTHYQSVQTESITTTLSTIRLLPLGRSSTSRTRAALAARPSIPTPIRRRVAQTRPHRATASPTRNWRRNY